MRLLNSILLLHAVVHAGPRAVAQWNSKPFSPKEIDTSPEESNEEGSGSSDSDVIVKVEGVVSFQGRRTHKLY